MGIFDSLFGGGDDAPKAPDYSPMIGAFNTIAGTAAKNGQDAMVWAKDQVANNKDLINNINTGLIDTQNTYNQLGKDKLASSGANIADSTGFLKDTRTKYSDPNRVAMEMGAAEANVGQAFDAARIAHQQELEGYGVNPGAVRFGALDIGTRTQRAAAQAGAGNVAQKQAEALAQQANDKILAQGNTEVGQAGQATSIGNAAGVGAVNNNLANTASGANVLGTGLQWTGANQNAVQGAVGAQNTGFNNQATSYKLDQDSSSGLGSLAGGLLGAMGKGGALAPGGTGAALMAMLAEGGTVPDGPVGGAIPQEASPSNGAITDDVRAVGPSGELRLNGGEFVIPKDVVQWEGEKSLQNIIMKARKAREAATAKPAVGGGPDPASPAFQPRPQPQGQPAVG